MRKTNPIYFLFMFLGLFTFVFSFGFVLPSYINTTFFIVPGIVFISIFTSIKLSNGTLQKKATIYKSCPYCRNEIDVNSVFCNVCGEQFNKNIICEYCGHSNSGELLQCEKCNGLLK
ncbi:hypothetical protein CI105_04040 [Candidatus Izimaplasma bacterium ZiA1]|uniref:zinc ribbon domain-containing protein n=1 Tax=Candidatus Izimoplasma sp. ZiA1 TaxID=2024899 RepID=UPI000BAA7C23|nr:hypothetical protein CI105_04040 [Candidatus Izimaplasma bacterium ZiA1]